MKTKILLLQDAVHLPSFGGGNKANRLLMEELAAAGFDCAVVARLPGERQAATGQFGPAALAARDVALDAEGDGSLSYRHRGVAASALDLSAPTAAGRIDAAIRAAGPGWILVSDDSRGLFLDAALQAAPDRVVILVHTHMHLPFGPEARTADPRQHARMRHARGIIAVSDYSRRYLREFGGLDATLMRFPVFGPGPFPAVGRADAGQVTMINPCASKGLAIFLDLADHFPGTAFAAVPTWGADEAVLAELTRRSNVTVIPAADDIGTVLRDARIVVAPSQMPETFGYVAVDAMLRGIPVLAGHLGGQPEAKLGVDFLLPADDPLPWRAALRTLISDEAAYEQCARASREAALRFLPETDIGHFIRYLDRLEAGVSASGVL
jgi:hypothetical protein